MDPTFESFVAPDESMMIDIKNNIQKYEQEIINNEPDTKKTFTLAEHEFTRTVTSSQKLQIAKHYLRFYNIAQDHLLSLRMLKSNPALFNDVNKIKEIRSHEDGLFHALRILLCKRNKKYTVTTENSQYILNEIRKAYAFDKDSYFVQCAEQLINDVKSTQNDIATNLETQLLNMYGSLYVDQFNGSSLASGILLYTLLDLYNVNGSYIMDELEEIPMEVFSNDRYKKIASLQLALSKYNEEKDTDML